MPEQTIAIIKPGGGIRFEGRCQSCEYRTGKTVVEWTARDAAKLHANKTDHLVNLVRFDD